MGKALYVWGRLDFIMITIGLHKYSRDFYGFDTASFNTSSLFKMGDVIAILQIYSDPERLTDLPRTIQLENGEIRFEFQVCMAAKFMFSASANRFSRNN